MCAHLTYHMHFALSAPAIVAPATAPPDSNNGRDIPNTEPPTTVAAAAATAAATSATEAAPALRSHVLPAPRPFRMVPASALGGASPHTHSGRRQRAARLSAFKGVIWDEDLRLWGVHIDFGNQQIVSIGR